MRYLGNKTKLLSFIGDFLGAARITSGRALDAFAGTAAVGSYLKSKGFAVVACDIMTYSYVFQRAYIVADEYPAFRGLRGDRGFQAARCRAEFASRVDARFPRQTDLLCSLPPEACALQEALVYLDSYLEPRASFCTMHYSGTGEALDGERMYFTRENALRIDAIRHVLHEWSNSGVVTEDEHFILLAALIEAADAVANTTGVYAAFVKSWQSNAVRPIRLGLPALVVRSARECSAHQGDVNSLIDKLGHFDVLYLDPPYNTRQYSAYYHVPEIIARGWFTTAPELRGKTGLIDDSDKRSDWSSRGKCVAALEDLLQRVDAEHIVMSYSSEGIIPEAEIERVFRAYGATKSYRRVGREYARYRSDSDSDSRRYKGDEVTEYLYYVQRGQSRNGRRSVIAEWSVARSARS